MNKHICIKCKYFFITWDKTRPYGCRAFGFKAKAIPSVVVKKTSGEDCAMFESKEGRVETKR